LTLNKILELSPWIEVFVRYIYWNTPIRKLFLKIAKRRFKEVFLDHDLLQNDLKNKLEKVISSQCKGRVVVIHSDFNKLKFFGSTSSEVLAFILKSIGPDATLVLPSIPIMRNKIVDGKEVKFFDYHSTRCTTGALPAQLLKEPNSVRSLNPYNNVVAYGPLANEICLSHDLTDNDFPCGRNSPWHALYIHDAKILFLGVDPAHSATMIHVAEDSWDSDWPVKNWYNTSSVYIKINDSIQKYILKYRSPCWSSFYAERTLFKDLINCNVLYKIDPLSTSFYMCSSFQLIEFLRNHRRSTYPYYIPIGLSCANRKNS
jgi:aminoglycoside 3-N-acetyltransferase